MLQSNTYGGYSSVAERRSVAADVVGSKPTSRPNFLSHRDTKSPLPRAPKFTSVAAKELAASPHNLYVGTSGWAYPTWKPGFYPADVPSRGFLHNYAARLTSVEVNYTFRTLPTAPQLKGWLEATPPGFRFSFKAPQRITHFQRLRESEETTAEFIAALKPVRAAKKLGPLLFQLPPNFAADPERLAAFLAMRALAKTSLQIAFEFRHPSWFADPIYKILRRHNAALCIAESDDLATPDVATGTFRCYRLRRNGGYSPKELKAFATRFTRLADAEEVFVYFKHEDEPTGALNAEAMLRTAAKLKAGR
jgi:uncharacterized protein YecE (DUF72 family)